MRCLGCFKNCIIVFSKGRVVNITDQRDQLDNELFKLAGELILKDGNQPSFLKNQSWKIINEFLYTFFALTLPFF